MRISNFLVVGLVSLGWIASSASAAVEVGDRPTIAWQTTDKQPISNDTLAGRIVVVDFWATWCGPCMSELPHMLNLYHELKDKGVVFVGISLDSSRRDLQRIVSSRKIPWPQVSSFKGWSEPVARAWGVRSIPQVFILTPEGKVFWKGHPGRIDNALRSALKEHPPVLQDQVAKELLEAASAAIDAAGTYLDDKDYPAALGAMAEVDPQVVSNDAVRRKLGLLLRKVQVQALDKAEWAAAREANPDADAKLAALTEALRVALHSPDETSPDGPRPEVIAARFEQAEKAHAAGQYLQASEGYDWLVRLAPQSTEGEAAAARLAAYDADAQISRALRIERAERDAQSTLVLARNYEKAGRLDLARQHYQQVLEEFAEAERSCAAAREALAKLE